LAQQTGVSVRHIAKIEKSTMNPSFEIVVLLCKALNITLDSLTDAKSINGEDLRDIVDLYSACPEQSHPVVKATLQALVFSLRENEKLLQDFLRHPLGCRFSYEKTTQKKQSDLGSFG